ncbi:hypothetical protein [Saccharolobus shibatae]|uniref:Uncharacterized protein n=1 Tax=Saccharolobus shibatae TaxID=2286 RepID=A0A8F5BYJ6_9CREN|nr:hypothetical protein [Saccharolobus shibatae]QXJ33822.1 hypothetical protein J5U22_00367 [Saccharolobus shibatae]
MVSVAVSEFILVVATLLIGLILFGLTQALIVPQYDFTLAEQQARALGSASFISVSPPDIGSTGYNFVIYPFIPGFKGNISLFIFEEPSSLLSSIAVLTPQSSAPAFSAYYPNGTGIHEVTIGPIYDTNGHELSTSLITYTTPANTPVIISGTIPKNYVIVIWIIYNSGNYYFRIIYTYTAG